MYKITRVVPIICVFNQIEAKVSDVIESLQDYEILIEIKYCISEIRKGYKEVYCHIGKVI